MDIKTASLSSKGWKSGLPDAFTMRPFEGPELRHIALAIEKKDMRPILIDALAPCLSVSLEALSIQDAYMLVFQQRMMLNSVMPLMINWQCKKPMFEYSTGIEQTLRDDIVPLNTFPCEHRNFSELNERSIAVAVLSAASDKFDLARMKNFEFAQESMFNWAVAHMGPDCVASQNILERQPDLKLWLELSKWTTDSRHGILTEINLTCQSCGRDSGREWTMDPSIFVG